MSSHVHDFGGYSVPLPCSCRHQHCVKPHILQAFIQVKAHALPTLRQATNLCSASTVSGYSPMQAQC